MITSQLDARQLDVIQNLIESIRAKHPTAEKPDPTGEPPWGRIYGHAEDGEGAEGQTACPECGFIVRYTISGYNGHMHGRCDNLVCFVRWMQ